MNDSRLVYSTSSSNSCPRCGKPLRKCRCTPLQEAKPATGAIRIRRQTRGKGGKTVTVISGLTLGQDSAKALMKEMKKLCGSGGTINNGEIEIQGDHRETILELLQSRFNDVKLAGG